MEASTAGRRPRIASSIRPVSRKVCAHSPAIAAAATRGSSTTSRSRGSSATSGPEPKLAICGVRLAQTALSRRSARKRQLRVQWPSISQPPPTIVSSLNRNSRTMRPKVASPYQPNQRPMPTARPMSARRWAEESRNRLVNRKGRRKRAVASRQPSARPRASALARLPPSSRARARPPPTGEKARASAQVGGACQTRIVGSTAQARRPAIDGQQQRVASGLAGAAGRVRQGEGRRSGQQSHHQRVEGRAARRAHQHRRDAERQGQEGESRPPPFVGGCGSRSAGLCRIGSSRGSPAGGAPRCGDAERRHRRWRRRHRRTRLPIGPAPAGQLRVGSLIRPQFTGAVPSHTGRLSEQAKSRQAKSPLPRELAAYCAPAAVDGAVSRPRPRASPPAPANAPPAP